MAEYINRAELISNLKEFANEQLTPLIENLIQKQPTADVAEVVRCRDCKYYEKKTGYCLKNSYFKDSDGMSCSPADSPDFTFFNEDDFCSYGARMDGDDNDFNVKK